MLVGVASLPLSFLPSANIGILLHKQATRIKNFVSRVYELSFKLTWYTKVFVPLYLRLSGLYWHKYSIKRISKGGVIKEGFSFTIISSIKCAKLLPLNWFDIIMTSEKSKTLSLGIKFSRLFQKNAKITLKIKSIIFL